MEKSTEALLALALLFTAFIASIEGGRDVPKKAEADGGSPLHTLTFCLLFPWWWGGKGGGGAQGSGDTGGCCGLGGLISWIAGHPWFVGHPWFAGHPWFRGYGGGGAPTPLKAYNQDVAKQGDTPW